MSTEMKRRGFMGLFAGLIAAPALVQAKPILNDEPVLEESPDDYFDDNYVSKNKIVVTNLGLAEMMRGDTYITHFKISGDLLVPYAAMTDIQNVVHEGVPAISHYDDTMFMDAEIGETAEDLNVGHIGFFTERGVLFAISTVGHLINKRADGKLMLKTVVRMVRGEINDGD